MKLVKTNKCYIVKSSVLLKIDFWSFKINVCNDVIHIIFHLITNKCSNSLKITTLAGNIKIYTPYRTENKREKKKIILTKAIKYTLLKICSVTVIFTQFTGIFFHRLLHPVNAAA